ncbi:MAG: ABC transporter permease [Mesorhizobium sp.]|nr:ABC transporter permease [Mesorhizobium sp.]MCO5160236.1 ABC transporter permease [Mesorhizobium sp.]
MTDVTTAEPAVQSVRPSRIQSGFLSQFDGVTVTSILILGGVLAFWEWVFIPLSGISPALLPKPSQIADSLWTGLTAGYLAGDMLITLQEIIIGYALGALIGFLLAIPVAEWRTAERILNPYIVATQAVPKVAIAPLFVVWFGFGMTSKVLIVALITFFPVFVNSVTGLRATPADQIEMLKVYNSSRWERFRFLKVQNAAPYIFAGLNVGVTLSVIGAIVAEFVGAQEGIGAAIMRAGFALDTPGVFAAIALLTFIAAIASALVQYAGRRLVFWMEPHNR